MPETTLELARRVLDALSRREFSETASPAGWMLRFRDGKVLRFRAFRAPERALEAVRAPE